MINSYNKILRHTEKDNYFSIMEKISKHYYSTIDSYFLGLLSSSNIHVVYINYNVFCFTFFFYHKYIIFNIITL